MKRPTFIEGVAVALVAGLGGTILFHAFVPFSAEVSLRVVIAVLSLAYMLYLLSRSRRRVGRVTSVVTAAALSLVLLVVDAPLSIYLLGHIGIVWLARALYFHDRVLPVILDLALTGFALAAGAWAFAISASLFLALWTFFLVQALFVGIPAVIFGGEIRESSSRGGSVSFERAFSTAEAALRRLSSNH